MRSIEIDFDIHKLIETHRTGFDDTPNDVLRHLLGLGATPSIIDRQTNSEVGREWQSYNVTLPHGTRLRMTYNGTSHFGQIENGEWLVDGVRYTSPSGAASGTARTKRGGRTRLDGWNYWEAQLPGEDNWQPIFSLWQKANPDKVGSPS